MAFITGRHMPRRSFLRGAGATVALPFMDAMVPAGRPWLPNEPAAGLSTTRTTSGRRRVRHSTTVEPPTRWDSTPIRISLTASSMT